MIVVEEKIFHILDFFRKILLVVWRLVLSMFYMFRKTKVPPVKNPILLMTGTELAKRIREGKLTSVSVVQAYIDRILEVEPFINSTVDCRFNDALKEAKEADELVVSKAMSMDELESEKPLLGVPFSVKVLLTVKGLRSTAGSVLFKDTIAQEDAEAVRLMKKAGAIVLVTTNSSEFGLNFQSINNLHGTTCNPFDTSRTSGGSSGGESALLGAAGSVIGLGNDLAGSVRLPSLFTGVFAHKPSRGLVSNAGCFPIPTEKLDQYLSTGPMCRYAEDLQTVMKVISASKEESAKFGQKVDFKDIKVYYVQSFGEIPLVENVDEEISDAVRRVASYFEIHHQSKVEKASIPLVEKLFSIFSHALLTAVPDALQLVTAGKEKIDPVQEFVKFLLLQSRFTLGFLIVSIAHKIPGVFNTRMIEFYQNLEKELDCYFNKLLDDRSVLVLPTMPFAAPYNYEIPLLIKSSIYCSMFNILGMPSSQCPVGMNRNGLPIGLQIVSKRGNDHLSVSCALEIQKAFGGWQPSTNHS